MSMIRRRALLAGLAGASLPLAAPRAHEPALGELRRLDVRFVHTGERFRGPFKSGDLFDPAALRDFSFVMADWRACAMRPFDPAVLDLLWLLGEATGTESFACLSGYRTPQTNRIVGGENDSQHLEAKALDLWLPAATLADAVDHARGFAAGGVGHYAGWMHVDTGPVRFWDKRHVARKRAAPALRSAAARPKRRRPG